MLAKFGCALAMAFTDWDVPHMDACVVGEFTSGDDGSWKCRLVANGMAAILYVDMDESLHDSFRATLFDFNAELQGSTWILRQYPGSTLIKHARWAPEHCVCVKEACTGVGALGCGLSRVGFVITARNEVQVPTAEVLRQQGAIPTVAGDICQTKVARALATADLRPCGLCAGFSCQPYSSLGDQRQGADSRAGSLIGVLRAAYLMQASFVMLECVTPASQSAFVRDHLDAFCRVMGYRIVEVCLELSDVWVAKRNRWWCLLVPDSFPLSSVLPWPSQPQWQAIQDVLPSPSASPEEYASLELSEYELCEFQRRRPLNKYLVNFRAPLQTALHSWGNQVLPCPCGCRGVPFSQARLSKGICAALIQGHPCPDSGAPNFRHMSAREVALLNGLSPLTWCGAEPRLALSLVGQLASPLQAAWVASHVAGALYSLGLTGLSKIAPIKLLGFQQRELLAQAEMAGLRKAPLHCTCYLPAVSSASGSTGQFTLAPIKRKRPEESVSDAASTLSDPESSCSIDASFQPSFQPSRTLLSISKRCFVSHFLCELPGLNFAPLVQIIASTGDLMPRDGLLIPGEQVEVWAAGSAAQGVGAASQSLCLPDNVGSFLRPSLTKAARIAALDLQGAWMTDDQMRFGLDFIACANARPTQVIDPLICQRCLLSKQPKEFLGLVLAVSPGDEIVTAFVHEGHWIVMNWTVSFGRIESWVSLPPGMQVEEVAVADWLFAKVARCRNFQFASGVPRPPAPGLCGHFALADLSARLQRTQFPDHDQALSLAAIITATFRLSLPDLCRAPTVIGGVAQHLLEQSLISLLQEKGACEGDVPSRAKAIVNRIGAEAIQHALSSAAPWKQLKALAGISTPPLQLILPSELQKQIDARGHSSHPANRAHKKKAQKAKHMPDRPVHTVQAPLPGQVQLPTGVFVNGTTGILLDRLLISEIGPQSEGVVLASPAEAIPYLSLERPVSTEALALLVIGEVSTAGARATCAQVRFHASCIETGEPLLLNGVLVQIGLNPVAKATPSNVAPLEVPQSTIARLAIFRDQWPEPWGDFAQGPMKSIVKAIPCLQTCSRPGCDCQAWHGLEGTPGEPDAVLEVFGRQFLDETYKTAQAMQAAVFNIFVRLPLQLEMRLQCFSGSNGIFIEPRGSEVKYPSERFSVIWLPKASFSEATLKKQSHSEALSLARVGSRYGLRCLAGDAQALHGKVRPDTPFVPRSGMRQFHTGPWPFGVQRSSISRAFKALQWDALPLQPIPGPHAGGTGIWWSVQAEQPPLTPVLATSHGEVLAVEQKPRQVPAVVAPPLVASKSALQRFQVKATEAAPSGVDHLQDQDPWQQYLEGRNASGHGVQSKSPGMQAAGPRPSSGSGAISVTDFNALARKLEDSVSAQVSQQISRVHQEVSARAEQSQAELSSRLATLQESTCQIEETVARQVAVQAAEAQRQVERRFEQVEGQVSALHQRVEVQESNLQHVIQGLFQAQTQRIEELLAPKRARGNEHQ